MSLLKRDQILASEDLKTQVVPVPEWGGDVIVRALRGIERDAYESSFVPEGDKEKFDSTNMRAKLVSRCCVDEQGNRLFSDEDALALGQKNAAALDRIFDVAQALSG